MTTEQIARVCHEANKELCATQGDFTQVSWEAAPMWQQRSAIDGVAGVLNGTILKPSDSHASWMRDKEASGWVFGPVKSAEHKTHPCLVPYDELPPAQQAKDYLFFAIADALRRFVRFN